MGKQTENDAESTEESSARTSTPETETTDRKSTTESSRRSSVSASSRASNATAFSRPTADMGSVQRAPQTSAGGSQRERNIQRALKGTDTSRDEVPGQVLDVIGSGGMPLDMPIQRSLEDRMDADFSDVRVHTGGKAAQAADAIDAKAFTCGNDIVFNAGEYDPNSAEGQHLLAHELAHVKQQNGGAPLSMKPKANADLEIDPDPQLEREADTAAQEALSEGPVTINRMGTDVHIQRSEKQETPFQGFDPGSMDDRQIQQAVDQEKNAVDSVNEANGSANEGGSSVLDLEPNNEFQQAVSNDIETLYERTSSESLLELMKEGSYGEVSKVATSYGVQTAVPGFAGKMAGNLAGEIIKTIVNNRSRICDALGVKASALSGSGKATGGTNPIDGGN